MRAACDSDSRCGLACDASTRDAKSLAMWVERCEPLSSKVAFGLPVKVTFESLLGLAHRNRSDFCDLRLRCPSRTPEIARFPKQEKALRHCDLRVRWKVASDLRFRAAISEPKTPSFCGISGDLAQSTRKSLAIAIVRFWCAKLLGVTLIVCGFRGVRGGTGVTTPDFSSFLCLLSRRIF